MLLNRFDTQLGNNTINSYCRHYSGINNITALCIVIKLKLWMGFVVSVGEKTQ